MRRKLILVLSLFMLGHTVAARETVPRAEIFKISVVGCKKAPKDRTLTGFRMAGQRGIFTALHGVIGAESISAKDDLGRGYINLDIKWVDIDRDVAVLWCKEMPDDGNVGLIALTDVDQYVGELHVLGYPLNSARVTPTAVLLRTDPIAPFKDFPPEIFRFLQSRGSPSPNVDALDVEGHVLPCDSGAPLVDAEDRILGIAIGGLEGGSVEYSYAIPIWQVKLVTVGVTETRRLTILKEKDLGVLLHASSGNSLSDWALSRDLGRSRRSWVWFRGGAAFVKDGVGESGWFLGTEIASPLEKSWFHRFSFLLEYTTLEYHLSTSYKTLPDAPEQEVSLDEKAAIIELGLRYYFTQRHLFWPYVGALGGISNQMESDFTGGAVSVDTGVLVNAAGRVQIGVGYRHTWCNQSIPEKVTFNPFGDADVQSQNDFTNFGRLRLEIGILLLR
jgi:hypothetical protein